MFSAGKNLYVTSHEYSAPVLFAVGAGECWHIAECACNNSIYYMCFIGGQICANAAAQFAKRTNKISRRLHLLNSRSFVCTKFQQKI